MEPQFWLERWQKHEIGFHQSAPHPALARFWSRLALRPGARVFVPLAGKSLDMLWLAQAGFQVVGIELSPIAVAQFAAEHAPEARRNVELRCGDFFALTRAALGPVDAVFDRAALVALPAAQRRDYVAQMTWLTGSGCATLLVTLEYPQERMPGPPFSVTADEVDALYGAEHTIECLSRDPQPADAGKFAARGVDRLAECVYLLRRR